MKPTARRRLGRYVLLGRIGHGGMGKIYLAHALGPAGIEKLLVVKRLHSHLTGDPILVSSFLDEARLSMALSHPNIGHTFDVGEVDGRYFMVMEYIDGQNLGVVLRAAKRSGKYPKSALWGGLFLSVLDGLHAAHTARDPRGRKLEIIHRDVSPQNILVNYEGLPKLVDFGIAKAAMRMHETDAGTLKGKYAYMSPEQVRGEPLDARSDVFAAGIVLWEMLASRRLYKADTIVRSVERVLLEPPVSPARVNPECAPALATVCLKALAKDKALRFSSADEFKDALEEAMVAGGERYKAVQTKEMMQTLFKEVSERQRVVLESCLNQQGEFRGDEEDDEPRRNSDSQSDLNMPQLVVSAAEFHESSTTPSAARRSPLVTAEGDESSRSRVRPQNEAKPTAVERGGPWGALAETKRALEGAAAATSGALPQLPDNSALTQTSARGLRLPTSQQRRLLVLLGAALAGMVAAVVGVGFNEQRQNHSVVSTGPEPPTVLVSAGRPVVGNIVVDAASAAASSTVPRNDESAAVGPAVDDAGTAAAASEVALTQMNEPRKIDLKRRGKKRESISNSEPVQRPLEPPPLPPPTAGQPGDDVDSVGFITLDTVPWTTVFLGKKKLGETPLTHLALPSGNLELTLVNAESNVREMYFVKLKAGETFKARLDLR